MKTIHARCIHFFLWVFIIIFIAGAISFPYWMKRFYPQPHQDLVQQMSLEYGVDANLVFAVIQAESNFENNALSHAGARGLMQIMPETAGWIAGELNYPDYHPDMLDVPAVNIRFGCWYLSSLQDEFAGELAQVIAAYNAGRGQVKQWIQSGNWDGSVENIDQVPYPETRRYIKKVIRNYEAYQALYPDR